MLVHSLLLVGLCFRAVLAEEAGITVNLAKRGLADDYSAMLSLVESAANAVATSTSCATPCENWMTSFGECSALQEELKVAECACAAGKVKQLDTCAACLGEEAEGQANTAYSVVTPQGFDNFCVKAKTQLGGSTTSSAGSKDSAANEGSSSETSGTTDKSAAGGGETAEGEDSAVALMSGRSGLLVAAMAGVIAVVVV